MSAYIDPGAGSYLFQILLGGVTIIAYTLAKWGKTLCFWRKSKPSIDSPKAEQTREAQKTDE